MNNPNFPCNICDSECKQKTSSAVVIEKIGPQGPKGDKGDPGAGLEILGTVDCVDKLPNPANNGDAYLVGECEPRRLCIFDGKTKVWIDQGTLQGEKGDTGDGLKIEGTVNSVGDLPNPANNGDAYFVGFVEPRDLYIFDSVTNSWINHGPIKGEKGDKGDKGEDGQSATIIVGTVLTGEPGTEASVTNRGTETDAIFDFVIPKGDTTGIKNLISVEFKDVSESITPLPFESVIPLPTNDPPIMFDFSGDFSIIETGYYEITFCGMVVGGTTTDGGGSVVLQNNTKGTPLDGMKFNLDAGKDHQMQFSYTSIYYLEEGTELRVMTVGAGSGTDVTSFNSINMTIKRLSF